MGYLILQCQSDRDFYIDHIGKYILFIEKKEIVATIDVIIPTGGAG
jgi:hypothetical protein